LQALRATFVTLHENGQLRGCIGTLEAHRTLVEDVAENAFSAAFRDPRFAPVSAVERDQLDLDISVLSPATPMQFDSEQDLLSQIRPGIDGLVLEDGPYRGTFLPAVWEQLPEPLDYLHQLKRKAGLSADYGSPGLKVSRYVTESFS
jgi:AmmeMemoRadiSam system protein A